jgi:hypothetical protein
VHKQIKTSRAFKATERVKNAAAVKKSRGGGRKQTKMLKKREKHYNPMTRK